MECKISVKIPDSVLDSALALRGKEGNKLSNVSNLVKTKPEHTNNNIKFLSREIKNATKYQQSLLTLSDVLLESFTICSKKCCSLGDHGSKYFMTH